MNCLVVLKTRHVILNKIEIKYKIKEQLPGGFKNTKSYSSVIKIIYKMKQQLPGCIKHFIQVRLK